MTANTPRSRKNKGAKFQKEVAAKLAETFELKLGRDEDFFGRQMGGAGTDIVMSREAKNKCNFDIECKKQEKWNIPEWWKQTTANTAENRQPLLVISKNHHESLAVLKLSDLLKLLK